MGRSKVILAVHRLLSGMRGTLLFIYSKTPPFFQILTIPTFIAAFGGCIVTINDKNNASHHVIIGFGIVETNETSDHAVVATDVSSLGITVVDRPGLKLGIGYTTSTVVTVAPRATDVRVEASKMFNGPLILDSYSTRFEPKRENQND